MYQYALTKKPASSCNSGLHDVDTLKHNHTTSDVAAIIAKMDAILSGIATTTGMERVQATGGHCRWTVVVLLYTALDA